MASSIFPDPLQLWRDAIARLEANANSLAAGSLKSPELVRSLSQATTVSSSMQQGFDKMVDAYLQRANLPSRKQLAELVQALERIEQKLDRLLPPDAAAPRPTRTRRPSAPVPASAAAEPAPSAQKKKTSKPKSKAAQSARSTGSGPSSPR